MGEYQRVAGIITPCFVTLEPFAIKALDGRCEGIAVNLRREVADEMGVDFELREYGSVQALAKVFVNVLRIPITAIVISLVEAGSAVNRRAPAG